MSDIQDNPLLIVEEAVDQGVRSSLNSIFSNRNYVVFLITGWMFNCYNHLGSYLNLYLKVMGWSLITIGLVLSIVNAFSSIARLIGGYVGDIANRKGVAVAAYLILGIYYVYVGIFVDFWLIFIGLMIYSVHDLFRSGSSSYIMENVPRDHSGFALSLFTAGRVFSVAGLLVFGFLEPILGFPVAFRFMYFITGLSLILASAIRAVLLESPKREYKSSDKPILSEFMSENIRAAKLLLVAIPGLIFIVILDTLSDSFFGFAALIYTYEELSVDIAGINLILLAQLAISFPLLLKIGRVSDRKGVKRAAVVVYSIMPVSAAFLLIAPIVPYIVPSSVVSSVDSVLPGLGIIFSTPFIGIVMKYVNDSLWWTLII
ncbi:MAG: MFS transporter, partial [Candidatus Thorarchaeota archaeon]